MLPFAMNANMAFRENDLVEWALEWLRARAPADWSLLRSNRPELLLGSGRVDAAFEVGGPGVVATIAVEAKRSLEPREVAGLFGSVGRTLRALSPNIPVLVVAPWLSARTRELLATEGVSFIDQTGNALVRLDRPALFIQTVGAARDPSPAPRAKARLRGAKAGRLIRFLVDVRPPYGVRELAQATGLTPGYVSRLLEALDDEALVERSKRGGVEAVDVSGSLRRWVESYDVFKSNQRRGFLAPRGAPDVLDALSQPNRDDLLSVTGSFAAARLAPVAAPALLAIYCSDFDATAAALGLLPADQGANVVLLRPFDSVVWERPVWENRIRYVAVSQAAVDCLTGNGRMPAEGEALVDWMVENEPQWRLNGIDELFEPETTVAGP